MFLCLISPCGAERFVLPFDATVYVSATGGGAAAVSQFGIGTSSRSFKVLLSGLPSNPSPRSEIKVGVFKKGESVPFALRTLWQGRTYWAFQNSTQNEMQTPFEDVDNSLGFGDRKMIEQLDSYTYVMHLDDAASSDDNDRDVLIQIRLEQKPMGPPELEHLRVQFNRDVQRLETEQFRNISNLRIKYIKELDALMARFTRAGDLDSALLIREEKAGQEQALKELEQRQNEPE